jgi:hypothetical protein
MKIGAWIATGIFAAMMAASGVAYVAGASVAVQAMLVLGYPPYFRVMLGVAKLLGVAALLTPSPSALREWAYAGFTFDLVAAVVSHLATGTSAAPAIFAFAILAASYVLRTMGARR